MSGTAMGTKMAPYYANLFIGVLEQQMLSFYKHKPLVYFGYIDEEEDSLTLPYLGF